MKCPRTVAIVLFIALTCTSTVTQAQQATAKKRVPAGPAVAPPAPPRNPCILEGPPLSDTLAYITNALVDSPTHSDPSDTISQTEKTLSVSVSAGGASIVVQEYWTATFHYGAIDPRRYNVSEVIPVQSVYRRLGHS